jgi:hypothetical protein
MVELVCVVGGSRRRSFTLTFACPRIEVPKMPRCDVACVADDSRASRGVPGASVAALSVNR